MTNGKDCTGVICKVWPNGCPHPELCQDKCFDDDIKREREYIDEKNKGRKMKKVTLVLEYDMGDYSDMEEEGGEISLDPKEWEEAFYQCDLIQSDLNVVKVRVEESENE